MTFAQFADTIFIIALIGYAVVVLIRLCYEHYVRHSIIKQYNDKRKNRSIDNDS